MFLEHQIHFIHDSMYQSDAFPGKLFQHGTVFLLLTPEVDQNLSNRSPCPEMPINKLIFDHKCQTAK